MVRRQTCLALALTAATVLGVATPAAAAGEDTREPVVTAAQASPPRVPGGALLSRRGYEPHLRGLGVGTDALDLAMADSLTTTAGRSRHLGVALSALVVDAADGTVIWRSRENRTRLPASTQKLLTTYTVLHSMNPDAALATRVMHDPADRRRIYLRGGGDPSLSTSGLRLLATRTAAALAARGLTRVSLAVDASILPTPSQASGWKASYRSDVQPPQGLTLAGYRGPDGAGAARRAFVAALAARGVTVSVTSAARAPAGSAELARVTSAPIRRMLATMLSTSNNDYAEFLLRHAARAGGATPSWRYAAAYETRLLARAGVPTRGLRIADGSGLSRSDRVPAATLAAVIRLLWNTPADAAVVFAWGALPRSGQTGTLAKRYRTSAHACARGKVLAKTGTLADAVALAGVAQSVDGTDRVFVFLENGRVGVNSSVRYAVDTLATTVVGCRLG